MDQKKIIEEAFQNINQINNKPVSNELKNSLQTILTNITCGKYRIAEQDKNSNWHTNEWLKKAILLYFKVNRNKLFDDGITKFYDKIPLRFADYNETDMEQAGVRIVPPAYVRTGVFLSPNTVVMPSHINIGSYIDSGTMIDTWANIGSCAQIGKNVHIASNVTIGGVLEPLQAHPTIIENDCFIGANSSIVEGIIIKKGTVVGTGVHISQSTPIIDRQSQEIHYGHIPAYSVVIAGNRKYNEQLSLACAVIIKKVDQKTRQKVAINDLLRQDI